MHRPASIPAIGLLVVAMSAVASADDAQQLFDQIYKDKIRQVRATVDKADDLALARSMLDAARDSTGEPKLLSLLCDAVVDHSGRVVDGADLALDALKIKQDHVPGVRAATRAAMIEILARQLAASNATAEQKTAAGESLIALHIDSADDNLTRGETVAALADMRQAQLVAGRIKSARAADLKLWMESVEHRQRVERRVADLRQRLLARADDSAAADECVTLILVDLDNPRQAETLLPQAGDATLKKMAPLAAQPVDKVTAGDALALGEWYKQLADSASAPAKERAYIRSETWLRHFLAHYADNDLKRKRVELLVKEVGMAASKVFFAQSPPPRGLVLLYAFDDDTIVERGGKRFVVDLSGGKNDLVIKEQKFENGVSGAAMVVLAAQHGAASTRPVGITGAKERTLSAWIKGDRPEMGTDHWPFIGWGEDGAARQFHIAMWRGNYMLWSWGFGEDYMPGLRRGRGEWEHVAATYDGQILRWFHNGKAAGAPFKHTYRTADSTFRISHGIGGWLDEVAVYNRALAPGEVAYLFANSRRGLRYGYAK